MVSLQNTLARGTYLSSSHHPLTARVVGAPHLPVVLISHHLIYPLTARVVGAPHLPVVLISHYPIYPLTARVVGALQMISHLVSSMFPCSPLLSGIRGTPGLSIP